MNDQVILELARKFARGRVSAAMYFLTSDFDRERWMPRVAGKGVRNADDPEDGYDTEAEAVAAAKRYRESCRRWLREKHHA